MYCFLVILRNDIYCSESPSMHTDSEVKECNLLKNNVYECIFQPFYLLSGYTMWIEIKHSLGTVTSRPVCILPKEVGKWKRFLTMDYGLNWFEDIMGLLFQLLFQLLLLLLFLFLLLCYLHSTSTNQRGGQGKRRLT